MKKFLKVIGHCMLLALGGFAFLMILLKMTDNFVYAINNNVKVTYTNILGEKNEVQYDGRIDIEDGMTQVQYAYNNSCYTYLKNGNVYIQKHKADAEPVVIDEELDITYHNLLYDKNLIIYFTEQKKGYTTTLVLYTFDIASEKKVKYKTFDVYNYNRVEGMEYSPVVNFIYLNIEQTNGNNLVYKIDLFNGMWQYLSGRNVKKLVMLKLKDRLYYELEDGTIYYQGYRLSLFRGKVDIIGLDDTDNVFFINEARDTVFVVNGNSVIKQISLEDSAVVDYYSNNMNVYLIYDEYILQIFADGTVKKVKKISSYTQFECIRKNKVYLRLGNNKVVFSELNK